MTAGDATVAGWHRFATDVSGVPRPRRFTYPFHYQPHPLAVAAADEVRSSVALHDDWRVELDGGKMLGVLVVADGDDRLGYLAAFSGTLLGRYHIEGFVPPVHDLHAPDGEYRSGVAHISALNRRIAALESSPERQAARQAFDQAVERRRHDIDDMKRLMASRKSRRDRLRATGGLDADAIERLFDESRHDKGELRRLRQSRDAAIDEARRQLYALDQAIADLKHERHRCSEALQRRLFDLFVVVNGLGERSTVWQVFAAEGLVPPGGTGECCAPKLLQQAFLNRLRPVCMAEFWWGASPQGEVRHHGFYYPACRSKCLPLVSWMLRGIDVDDNPLAQPPADTPLAIVHDDPWMTVVNKPAGLLSVPGVLLADSVLERYRRLMPQASGPIVVHRLDQETSGLMVLAKDLDTYRLLQRQFAERQVHKTYEALLEGTLAADEGTIDLPLRPDVDDRPRQCVDAVHGRAAVTRYCVLDRAGGRTRVELEPLTGRTHQLRVHCSHALGLGVPIVGDTLYGTADRRLMLHARTLSLVHPVTGQPMQWTSAVPF